MQTGKIIAMWLGVWSLADFVVMAADKGRAQKHKRRISEKTLLLLGLFGGAWGGWLGMLVFRHKTKHLYFRIGFPLMALVQTGLILWMLETGVI